MSRRQHSRGRELLQNHAMASGEYKAGSRKSGRAGWLSRLVRSGPRQINRKAALTILGVTATIVVLYFPLRYYQESWLRKSALAQARAAFDAGSVDKALMGVEAYLAAWPNDLAGLEMKGELVSKTTVSNNQLTFGIKALEDLLRLDPDSPARQEDRKRLIELLIRLTLGVRAGAEKAKEAKLEDRSIEAYKIAAELIKKGSDDAESHRLLARTLDLIADTDGTVTIEDPKDPKKAHLPVPAGPEAMKEYQKALRKDKGDSFSAERLAELRMKATKKDQAGADTILNKKDQAGADAILNKLVADSPRSVDARLVRARHLLNTGREEKARDDVEFASKLDSSNKNVRIMAAGISVRRGDAASARRHLAAIPKADRDDTRVHILLSSIEILDRRPEQAIEKLRDGLKTFSGSDRELTWWLAHSLIQLGRPSEARPLMDQYRRLVGKQNSPRLQFLEGLMLEKSSQHRLAIEVLQKGSENIDGELKPELYVVLGRCHAALGEFDAAKVAFEEARNASPSSISPRQELARLLLRTDPEATERAISELEAISPSQRTSALLADLAMAYVARQQALPPERRNWQTAETASGGLAKKPEDLDLLRARVAVLAAQGKLDEAGSVLEEATKGFGRTSEDVWLVRAQFLERRGQYDEAVRVLEQGSNPNAAGDKARLRAARASFLARSGHGRAALGLLAVDVEKFKPQDRAILVRDKTELLLTLGDRHSALLACNEWSELAPEDLGPGLKLIEMARRGGTDEELKAGVDLLHKAVGDKKGEEEKLDKVPIALAAQALAILVPTGINKAVTSDLDQAEVLAQKLEVEASQLPVTSLIRGLLFEQNSEFDKAAEAFEKAIKGDTTGLALPRLVALLTRLGRTDELAALKGRTAASTAIDRTMIRETLGVGDQEHKEKAEALLADLVKTQPDILEYRADLARLLHVMGKPQEAEKTLRDLVDRQPNRPQPWLALLASQLEQKATDRASATVERLKTEYKGERPDLLLARSLWAINDHDAANKVCDRELARRPDDLETIRLASEIQEAIGRTDLAESLLIKARNLDPNLPWARRRLALILSGRANHSRWAEARALLAPSSGSSDSPEDRMTRALVLERGPDRASRDEAIRVYRSLVEDLPSYNLLGKKARLSLAQLLLSSRDAAAAARAIQPAIADSTSADPTSLVIAIEALTLEGKAEEARRLFERLTEVQSPDLPSTIACEALVLKSEGNLEGAIERLVKAASSVEKGQEERLNRFYFERLALLGIGADDATEKFGRAMIARWPAQGTALARFLASHDRFDEALDLCRPAIEAGSPVEPLQFIQLLDTSGRLDESRSGKARELAIAAALRVPKDAGTLAITAAILRRQGRFEDEVGLYRKLLAIDPANIVARNNLAWGLAHDLGKPAEALVEVDRVIKQAGPLPAAIDTRGMILSKLGRLDEAIADLEKAAKVDPSAVHQIHLARAYAQAGRLGDRRKALELARLAAANPSALEPEDRAELDAVIH
jgi:tetratricopeptide (TPR) repeat protein